MTFKFLQRATSLFIILVSFSSTARAQKIAIDETEKLLSTLGLTKTFNHQVSLMFKTRVSHIKFPDNREIAEKILESKRPTILQSVGSKYQRVLKHNLSDEEVKQLVQFFSSPLGLKYLQLMQSEELKNAFKDLTVSVMSIKLPE